MHGGGGPQVGEVTRGGSPHLSCKLDQIKMRDYMNRRVTVSKRVTSPIWGPPTPCNINRPLHGTAGLQTMSLRHELHCLSGRGNCMANASGGSRGGARGGGPLPLILDQTEACRAENKFFEIAPPPLISRSV